MTEVLTGTPLLSDARVVRALELVWHEADLLDHKEYAAWQELYADDGRYVIPIDRETEDFDDVLNMVYDDAHMRALRVQRMTEGHAIAAVDSAATVRTVSRLVPLHVTDDEVTLRAAQLLLAYKRGNHDIWASENTYVIRLSPLGNRIVRKIIRLLDSEDPVPAAGFLL